MQTLSAVPPCLMRPCGASPYAYQHTLTFGNGVSGSGAHTKQTRSDCPRKSIQRSGVCRNSTTCGSLRETLESLLTLPQQFAILYALFPVLSSIKQQKTKYYSGFENSKTGWPFLFV